MDAGPEVDVLIHEHVLHLPVSTLMHQLAAGQMRGFAAGAPPYSTDIATAFQVVAQLHTQGLKITLEQGPYDWWTCRFTLRSDGKTMWQASDVDTAPQAICLAALKAVGYD